MRLAPTFPWSTERVELFVLEPSHVTDEYVSWLSDPVVNRFLESRFSHHDRESTLAYVSGMLANPDVLMLGIRSIELDRHVGNIKLAPIDRHHGLGEIGLLIGDRLTWGRGVGSDSIALMVSIAARQLGLRKLTAGCYASNVGSARAFKKAGFSLEGVRKNHFLLDGVNEDLLLMARFTANDSTEARVGQQQ